MSFPKPYRNFFAGKFKRKKTPQKEGTESTWAQIYSGLQSALRLAAEATSGVPVPGLEGAIKAILFIMANVDRASQNLDDFKSLQSHLEACQTVFRQYESESLPPIIEEAIRTLSSQIQAACDCTKPIINRSRVRRILGGSADALMFQTQIREIDAALKRFELAATTFNSLQINKSLDMSFLDKLTNVEGAHYNSRERKHVTRCLLNTRVNVIKDITDWIDDETASPVFWLNSTAGIGKSTVAQSIAENCAGKGVLAGHFFFSRDKQNRFSTDGFFSTLARQMCSFERLARLVPHLVDAIKNCASISEMRNPEMFSRLLVQPLLHLKEQVPDLRFPMVVVIDALDECRDTKDAAEVLALLLDNNLGNKTPPILKFLITSRPEPHIRKVFDANKGLPPKFTEYPLGTDSDDVELYLRMSLAAIRADPERSEFFNTCQTWPEPDVFEKLLSKADGLFIYASTILKFVADEDEDPVQQLKLIMDTTSPQSQMYEELDILYAQIVHQVRDWERVQRILGAITLVVEPLSTEQLELLLGLNMGHARLSMRRLHSVLVVPADNQQPVRLVHPSFHDFLTAKERSGKWYIDPSVQHGRLAVACMKVIRDGCQAGWHTSKDTKPAQRGLLSYACRFWAYHLSPSDSLDPTLVHAVDEILRSFIRLWFDACIELNILYSCQNSLSRIFGLNILRPELVAFLCHEIDRFGVLISTKYAHSDSLNVLVPALFEDAIRNFPGGDPPHHFKCHHGSAQRRRAYSSRRTLHDIILGLRAVLHSLPHDHKDRGVCLAEMALCHQLISRMPSTDPWDREEDQEEIIDESEPLLHEALTLMLDDDVNKSVCCNSYGLTLLQHFEAREDISDLNQAVERFQQALTLPSPSPSITATLLNNLGSALANRFTRLRADEDASAALTALEAASNHPSAPPSVAFKASLRLARCLKSRRRDSPLAAYHLALKKALRISWTALSGDEIRTLFGEVIACGDEASIVAIEESDLWGAIECFDQSRTTFWMDGLGLRGPFFPISQEQSRLQTLAVSIERERDKEPTCTLNIDLSEFPPPTETEALVQEFDRLLQSQSDIVEMSLKYKQFMAAQPEFFREGGRIILLCAGESQAFALVLQQEADNVLSIPLSIERKRLDEIQHNKGLWNSHKTSDGKVILQDSWNLVAKPIISALGLKPGMPLTRTWWCPSASFMDYPIHAATNYEANPHEYLTDYMISSYIPSLSYLFNKNFSSSTTRRSGLLCLPGDSPHSFLGNSSYQDIAAISGIVPCEQLLLLPEVTEIEPVLSKMRECSGIHVASQSSQEHDDPANGHFSLPNNVYLCLNQLLFEPSFPSFAYLSTYPTHSQEHEPSTCRFTNDLLAVGFSSIVATQERLSPKDAAAMASAFYSELLQARGKLDFSFAAHALHAAMIKIREDCGDEPKSNWVRMIHVGV